MRVRTHANKSCKVFATSRKMRNHFLVFAIAECVDVCVTGVVMKTKIQWEEIVTNGLLV